MTKYKTTKMEIDCCPECGSENDAATSMTRKQPAPGDWAVCAYCTAICRFDERLKLRLTTLAEREHAPAVLVTYVKAALMRQQSGGFRKKS